MPRVIMSSKTHPMGWLRIRQPTMRTFLIAVAVAYSLIGLLYVVGDGRTDSPQQANAGARTWTAECPPVEMAPTCGRPDLYPTVAP